MPAIGDTVLYRLPIQSTPEEFWRPAIVVNVVDKWPGVTDILDLSVFITDEDRRLRRFGLGRLEGRGPVPMSNVMPGNGPGNWKPKV